MMNWVLNRKCFAALRALGSGTDNRWNYIHCGPKGVTATDGISLVRVSLPTDQIGGNPEPEIFPADLAKSLIPKGEATVTMPEGMPAKTTGQYIVPNYEAAIPDPKMQKFSIIVNAKRLIELLKGAVDVTEHSKSLVCLRLYGDFIRIDAHRDTCGQEFTAFMTGVNYNGDGIPGDPPKGTPSAPASEDFKEKTLVLPITGGRLFRNSTKDN